MTKEEYEKYFIDCKTKLDEIKKTYNVSFDKLEDKDRYWNNYKVMNYTSMVNWFFEMNAKLHTKRDNEIVFIKDSRRSLRDIYITLCNETGKEIDFIKLINVLIKKVGFFFCSDIDFIVFNPTRILNPINNNGLPFHYYYTGCLKIDPILKLSPEDLVTYYKQYLKK